MSKAFVLQTVDGLCHSGGYCEGDSRGLGDGWRCIVVLGGGFGGSKS